VKTNIDLSLLKINNILTVTKLQVQSNIILLVYELVYSFPSLMLICMHVTSRSAGPMLLNEGNLFGRW